MKLSPKIKRSPWISFHPTRNYRHSDGGYLNLGNWKNPPLVQCAIDFGPANLDELRDQDRILTNYLYVVDNEGLEHVAVTQTYALDIGRWIYSNGGVMPNDFHQNLYKEQAPVVLAENVTYCQDSRDHNSFVCDSGSYVNIAHEHHFSTPFDIHLVYLGENYCKLMITYDPHSFWIEVSHDTDSKVKLLSQDEVPSKLSKVSIIEPISKLFLNSWIEKKETTPIYSSKPCPQEVIFKRTGVKHEFNCSNVYWSDKDEE